MTDASALFVSPAWFQRQRPVELQCARSRTVHCTAAAIPALIRMENERGLPLLRVWHKNVDLTSLNTGVASDAFFRIDPDRHTRCCDIRHCVNLIAHDSPPFSFYKRRHNPGYGLHTLPSYLHPLFYIIFCFFL